MKRSSATIMITSISALFIILFLLVNLTEPISSTPTIPVKKEVSIDIVIEKKKLESPKPKVVKAKVTTSKAPSSTTSKILNGALPPVSANYRKHLGFKRYANAMYARGARFYILGGSKKQIYEINFSSKSLHKVLAKDIINKNFSPRTRIIEDEPALHFFCNKAKEMFDIVNPRVILLVPQQIEQKIASTLSVNGIDFNKFRGFRGIYLISSGHFTLKINEGVSNSGKQAMNVTIPL